MRRAALPSSGLYPLAVLCLTFLAYGAAAAVHASGFAAVYVAALVLGNAELPHRAATRSFAEGVAWLAQIGLFVMLGLLLSPSRITLAIVGLAVVAGLMLTFVARPLSVLVSSVVQPMPLARAGVHLVGGAARRRADRAHHHPAGRGRRRRRAALRHRLRDGRGLHPADRPDAARGRARAAGGPALRAARPRRRGGAAGAGRRRPAADHDQPGLAAARRRGRRAAAAAGRLGVAGHPRRASRWCPSGVPCCATATTCSWSPRARLRRPPRSGCARSPRRPAGPVARRAASAHDGADRSGSPAGCRPSRRRGLDATDAPCAAASPKRSPTHDDDAGARGRRLAGDDLDARCRTGAPTRRRRGSSGSSAQIWARVTRCPWGRCRSRRRRSPRLRAARMVRAGEAARGRWRCRR